MHTSRRFHHRPFVFATALLGIAGCHRQPQAEAPLAKPAGPPQVSDAVLSKYKPNEAGAVMILMYHAFDPKKPDNDLNRQPNTFRHDLEELYKRNYRPVTVSEFVENHMDVPAGCTPVVLTFDDSLPTQFRTIEKNGKPSIDPDCAVGIMETFHKQHADWPLKGTFFVLPGEGTKPVPFYQPESADAKLGYLLKNGYEIANHTTTHSDMHGMNAAKVQWELATARRDLQQMNKDTTMEILALPYGRLPRDKAAREALAKGQDGGTTYEHKAVIMAAYRPVMSPLTRNDKKITMGGKLAPFFRWRIERVKPNPKEANKVGTFEYWLQWFDANPSARYVSDGDPQVAAVPASLKSTVDEERARAQGKTLQIYGGAGGKGGGGELSVQ